MVPRLAFAAAVAASARDVAGTSARLARTTTSSIAVEALGPRESPAWRRHVRLGAWLGTPAVMLAAAHPVQLLPGVRSPIVSIDYTLLDKVALLLLPSLLLASRLGNVRRQLGLRGVRETWRWTGPLLPAAALVGAMGLVTFATRPVYSPAVLGAALLIGLVQGGFPEEVFYRCLLQTRLELLLGSVAGIGITSLLFGFRHLPTLFLYVWLGTTGSVGHDLALATACVFAYHAVLGVLYGCLWTRYRNAWANITAHTLFDTLAFLPLLA